MERKAQRFAGASLDIGWVGAFGWLTACLIFLFMHGVLVVAPGAHPILSQEDGWVESLTAVAYFLAGAFLFAAAWAGTRTFPRLVFLAGGVAMAFIAGEEISWGQRILNFPTPDFLAHNAKGEFNFHNLPIPAVGFLMRAFHLSMMLLCLTGAATLFFRKEGLFGIPFPSPLLLMVVVMSSTLRSFPLDYTVVDPRFWPELDLVYLWRNLWWVTVLALLTVWALLNKRPAVVLAAVATFVLCMVGIQVREHYFSSQALGETREFLLGLFWLFYARELLHQGDQFQHQSEPERGAGALQPQRRGVPGRLRAHPAGVPEGGWPAHLRSHPSWRRGDAPRPNRA